MKEIYEDDQVSEEGQLIGEGRENEILNVRHYQEGLSKEELLPT
ncbi:MAG: hypothetical protein V3R38_01640 [bacterium]